MARPRGRTTTATASSSSLLDLRRCIIGEVGEGERCKGKRQVEGSAEDKEKVWPFEQLVLVQLERMQHNKQHIERHKQPQLDLSVQRLQELVLECKSAPN